MVDYSDLKGFFLGRDIWFGVWSVCVLLGKYPERCYGWRLCFNQYFDFRLKEIREKCRAM